MTPPTSDLGYSGEHPVSLPYDAYRVGREDQAKRVLFVEDGRGPRPGIYNDGCGADPATSSVGSAHVDPDIRFNGVPAIRLDPQGSDAGAQTDPSTTGIVTGIIIKRRLMVAEGIFSVAAWFCFGSNNHSTGVLPCLSLYTRDGLTSYQGRLWLDPCNGTALANGNKPVLARPQNSDGTYVAADDGLTLVTAGQSFSGHAYDIDDGNHDHAMTWSYARLTVNLSTKQYVSAQLNRQAVDLSGRDMFDTPSGGAPTTHFSFEFAQTTTTRRHMWLAQLIGIKEAS